MKVSDVILNKKSNYKKAKKIRDDLLSRAKDNNPDEQEIVSGWNADPHQGTFDRMRMTR